MAKTVQIALDDDISRVVSAIQREPAKELVLVCPKQCLLFSDPVNLRLLQKQVSMMGKRIAIMTLDEHGSAAAVAAGISLVPVPLRKNFSAALPSRQNNPTVQKTQSTFNHQQVRQPSMITAPVPPLAPVTPSKPSTPQGSAPRMLTSSPARPNPTSHSSQTRLATQPSIRVTRYSEDEGVENLSRPISKSKSFEKSDQSRLASAGRFPWVKLLVSFILLAVVAYLVIPGADIVVVTKADEYSRDIEVVVDASATEPDQAGLRLPGQVVKADSTVQDSFQTLGKKEIGAKAQGQVAIYNLTGNPLNLKAGTTVLSANGKNYYFTADVQGAKPVAEASAEREATAVSVMAENAGEDYNLPVGTRLEITNQAFGNQPQRLYARTTSELVGGASRFVSVITKDDLVAAQKKLVQSVVNQSVSQQAQPGSQLIDDAYTDVVKDMATDRPEGSETPNFRAQATVSVKGLAFSEPSLKEMLRSRFASSLAEGRQLQSAESDKLTYRVRNLDVERGTMLLTVKYVSASVAKIDIGALKSELVGQPRSTAGQSLIDSGAAERIDIVTTPEFWPSLPRLGFRMNVRVQ